MAGGNNKLEISMKITITSVFVEEKKWEKGDRSGLIRTQMAVAECDLFRHKIKLDLGKNDPYPIGEYLVNIEEALDVGDFGELKLSRRLPLVPVQTAKPAPVKAA